MRCGVQPRAGSVEVTEYSLLTRITRLRSAFERHSTDVAPRVTPCSKRVVHGKMRNYANSIFMHLCSCMFPLVGVENYRGRISSGKVSIVERWVEVPPKKKHRSHRSCRPKRVETPLLDSTPKFYLVGRMFFFFWSSETPCASHHRAGMSHRQRSAYRQVRLLLLSRCGFGRCRTLKRRILP